MVHYIKLEFLKTKFHHNIWISICAILFCLLFITISLIDSATDPTQRKDTFDNIFQMIEVLLSFIYIIFYGVLVSTMIIKEYNTRTILIMFSYPINRIKFIGAKLLLISSFIALSLLAGYVVCCGYVIVADFSFDLLDGSFQNAFLIDWGLRAMLSIIICICIGLLTFGIGMIYTSVPVTIVSSIILILIRQIALSSAYGYTENLLQTFIVIVITILYVSYSLHHKIDQIK